MADYLCILRSIAILGLLVLRTYRLKCSRIEARGYSADGQELVQSYISIARSSYLRGFQLRPTIPVLYLGIKSNPVITALGLA